MGIKLKDGSEITGTPNKAEYHKNENGLYTVDIKTYLVTKPNGEVCEAYVRIPNAKLPTEEDEGVIELNFEDFEFYSTQNNSEKQSIFNFILDIDKE